MSRERAVIGILAPRRSGKTALTSLLARQAKSAGARIRLVDPSGNLGGNLPPDLDGFIEKIVKENTAAIAAKKPVPTTLLVLDDADAYLPKIPKPGSAWQQLFLCSAQLDLDIIYNGKRLANLSPSLLNSTTWLYVGRVPRSDFSGAQRTGVLLDPALVPTLPFHWCQCDPSSGEHYKLRTVNRNGKLAVEYIK